MIATRVRRVCLLGWAVGLALMTGCVAPIPFDTVRVGGEPTVRTGLPARLLLTVGPATSEANLVAAYQGRSLSPDVTNFGAQRQKEFAEALRAELLRLEVFESVTGLDAMGEAPEKEPVELRLQFDRTRYETGYHNYLLDVQLLITFRGASWNEHYAIDANEGVGGWELANSNLYDAQIRAVQTLLTAIVRDVQAWAERCTAIAK